MFPIAALFPLLALLVFTFYCQPYKRRGHNYTSLINIFVMIFLVSFKIYVRYINSGKLNTNDTYIYLVIAL